MLYSKPQINLRDSAIQTAAAGTVNGAAHDVKSSKSLVAFVIATIVGTSLAVKLQGSPDGTNFVDLPSGAFASITAPGTYILEWPAGLHLLPAYIRVVSTVVGADTTFAVVADLEPIC